MKYIVFCNESNDFADVLSDATVKPAIRTKMSLREKLILGFEDQKFDTLSTYITLKYGDMIKHWNDLFQDHSPVPGKDYVPIRKHRGKERRS